MALFYHYSHTKCETLHPKVGRHRHKGEDPNVVGEPVVWLHNRELESMEDADGILEFLHVVELDESDPNLFREEGFNEFIKQVEEDTKPTSAAPWRWYFYKGSLPVKEVRKWDGGKYVRI